MNNDEQVLISLRKIIRAIDLHSRKLEKASGLTGPQILVLKSILEHDKLTPGDIARDVNLSQATVTSILDRLQNKGYIKRERSAEDKRKVLISPTESGDQVYQFYPGIQSAEGLGTEPDHRLATACCQHDECGRNRRLADPDRQRYSCAA